MGERARFSRRALAAAVVLFATAHAPVLTSADAADGDREARGEMGALGRTGRPTLSVALDAARTWKTGGAKPWIGQTAVSNDLTDAARTGTLGKGKSGWLRTTVEGPTTVSFWWKTSAGARDKLSFSVDGVVQASVGGNVSWQLRSFRVGPGRHVAQWEFKRSLGRAAGLSAGFVDQVEIVEAPRTAPCEGCHGNPPHAGCDGVAGTADDAPNVMGNGTAAAGTGSVPKPFDDGAFGFNVNGHGANGRAARGPAPSFDPNLACTDCHNIQSPTPNRHFECDPAEGAERRVNTRFVFGKTADTRNANTSHLLAGYLAGAGTPEAKQVGFDDYCSTTCHPSKGVRQMRHARSDASGRPGVVMEFSIAHDTTDDPKRDRGADNVWTPWTIADLTSVVSASPPAVHHYGVCVSCHDPHGTALLKEAGMTNKMIVRSWKEESMRSFCSSNCHIIP